MPSIFIIPTAHGWNFLRSGTPAPSSEPPADKNQNGSWNVRKLQTLGEAVPLLAATDDFVLGLPVTAVLAQRFRLPSVDPAEFPEMIRIQIEKVLPFSAEEVTTDFEVIEQVENESVVSAVAIRNEQLAEIAAPLLDRGFIPRQVTVYAAQRASTYAPKGNALLIYPEGETLVYAMTENGKLSLARVFENGNGEQLQLELPQLRMSAELQGINASFPNVLLDESCYQMRETVEGVMASPTEIVGIELPPAAVKLNLLPESWRRRRSQLIRQAEWRKRLMWIGGAYLALLFLCVAYLGLLRFRIGALDRRIAHDAPETQFVRATEANWKALSPAIDARFYPVEILLHLFESLPSPEVRITAYNQSARQISVDGEANTAALAYQFIEKIKKNADLRVFQFDMAAPRILPNDHAQFRLEEAAMMPAWYQRMNQRERVLAWVAAGTVFALLNLFILDWIFGALASAQKQLAARRATLTEQALYVKERDLWTKRDEWIRQYQPTLKDPAEASALLDQLKEIAGKYNILVDNPAIGSGETTPYHQTVFASIETKSPWPPLVHFLYDVQRPDAFIVFENVNLAIDGNDPTMMRGKFKIARWFAPAQRTK